MFLCQCVGDDADIAAANAALIVRAVNAHDALVAACEAAELVIPRDRRVTLDAIRAALALAKGGDR